jgi:adenylate cyclase
VAEPLTEAELADVAATTPAEIRRLAALGILASENDRFSLKDVVRIRLVEALASSGISVETLATALREGVVALDFVDDLFSVSAAVVPGQTMASFAASAGLPWDALVASQVRLGLPAPRADDPVRVDDAEALPGNAVFLQSGIEDAAIVRFSRVMGENVRRLAEAQVRFYVDAVLQPQIDAGVPVWEVFARSAQLNSVLAPAYEGILMWLYRRHQEAATLQVIVERLEASLDEAGLIRRGGDRVPAMMFVDLTGFTRLTEERGDEAAATLATDLAELVQEVAERNRGRPVKFLGDGVMFHVAERADAVRCALHLIEGAPRVGLPAAHAGVAAGPVVFRDGDYYGRTVNLAARVSAAAGESEVLVTDAVVEAGGADDLDFSPLGPVTLKNVDRPHMLHRATWARGAPLGDRESSGS